MSLTVQSWWPLALLVVLPLVWGMTRRTLTSFGARQLRLQAVVRTATLALAVLALTQPVWQRSSGRLSVVYAVDRSASVAPASIDDAVRWVETARASGPADSRVLDFGSSTATNLAGAIDAAIGAGVPGSIRRVVLLTDGRATAGDLAGALARAQDAGVRVFAKAAMPRQVSEPWIEEIACADEVTAGEPFAVDVVVGSQRDQEASIEIRQGGRTLAREAVRLGAGSTRVSLAPTLRDPGTPVLEVALVHGAPADAGSAPRRLAVTARPRPRVLHAEGRPESARYLAGALEDGGFDVDTITPDRLPDSAEALDRYAAVVLSDVGRGDLTDARMAALDRYVGDLGGGLVMAGGEAMYGLEGFSKTQLERTLPIIFRMKDKPDEFAMVIVLDKSWSMAGQKIELAKEAAVAAVEVLPDRHRIGLLVFNDGMEWVVPLQLAANRTRIIAAIRAIVPSGHTNLFPALEEASRSLAASKADIKHVLVLSDGRTYPDEYETLLRMMADGKMTASSVALGEDADRELLANIATWGRGRHYVVENALEVPQVFVKETQRATRSTFNETPLRPIVKKPVEALAGLDFASAPPLLGYARTQAKETAEVILAAGDEDDPILVRWPYGLGRAVAFTSDLKDRWAHDWIAWPGYGKFWTQLVRETMRRDEGGGGEERVRLVVTRDGGQARVEIAAEGADLAPRNFAPLRVDVEGGDGRLAALEARQIGPGAYEARAALGPGDHLIRVRGADSARVLAERRVLDPPSLEARFMAPDVDLLKAIARDTGGVFDPRPADVFADRGDRATVTTPLWPWLAALAALLWLVDLGLRRVRLFEQVGT